MVYCTSCGEQNEEGVEYCKKCGAPLGSAVRRRRRRSDREMCFGVPVAGYTWGLVFGFIIILWGASQLLDFNFEFWPLFVIAFGLIILYNALKKTKTI